MSDYPDTQPTAHQRRRGDEAWLGNKRERDRQYVRQQRAARAVFYEATIRLVCDRMMSEAALIQHLSLSTRGFTGAVFKGSFADAEVAGEILSARVLRVKPTKRPRGRPRPLPAPTPIKGPTGPKPSY